MDPTEIRERAAEIHWWHTIDLGHGITTSGKDPTPKKLLTLKLPPRLDGMSVLDIGARDGAFSFEAERRGAARVRAVEPLWADAESGARLKRGFELARAALRSKVEDAPTNVHALDREDIGTFDLVLFLGVLYHLRDPIGALQRVASVAGDHLILETHADLLDARQPAARFYPGTEARGDPTNWWGPNRAALIGMLRGVGFEKVEVVYCTSRLERIARAVHHRFSQGIPVSVGRSQGRVVVHAWR